MPASSAARMNHHDLIGKRNPDIWSGLPRLQNSAVCHRILSLLSLYFPSSHSLSALAGQPESENVHRIGGAASVLASSIRQSENAQL